MQSSLLGTPKLEAAVLSIFWHFTWDKKIDQMKIIIICDLIQAGISYLETINADLSNQL